MRVALWPQFRLLGVFSILLAAGCGGGAADPFSRVQVTGTVTLDGQPVQWGTITLLGEKNEKTQERARASRAIVDGKIVEEPGATGTTAGSNEISVIIYGSDPAASDSESDTGAPVIKGTWLGVLDVSADAPLEVKMDKGSLERPTRD